MDLLCFNTSQFVIAVNSLLKIAFFAMIREIIAVCCTICTNTNTREGIIKINKNNCTINKIW